MTKPSPLALKTKLVTVLTAAMSVWVGFGEAAAQPFPPAPGTPPVPPAEAVPAPAPAPVPMAEVPVAAPAAPAAATDHDGVVGLLGVEGRRIGTFQRTQNEDPACQSNSNPPCISTADLNLLGVRKWLSQRYAFSLGLAVAAGSGSRRNAGTLETFDTYLGFGPSVGASFLLANWKHLAVSVGPELDVVYFLPSGKGAKSLLVKLRGLVEGEVHLGMIGLPEASVALNTGLDVNYLRVSEDTKTSTPQNIASRWSVGFIGPTSLWSLVTNATLRYYF